MMESTWPGRACPERSLRMVLGVRVRLNMRPDVIYVFPKKARIRDGLGAP